MAKQSDIIPEKSFGICSIVNQAILLNIAYQLTKFQGSSSNSFRDIFLTSLKCPNLQRAITLANFNGICSKVNQVIYSSFPVSSPSLRSKQFSRYLADKFKMPKFAKGHNSGSRNLPDKKKKWVSYFLFS